MTTKITCPQCGGVVYATGELTGENPCSCNSRTKRCVSCGKDVTHDRRMKDHNGNYWCLSCGIEDQKRRHVHGMICADCQQKYPAKKMESMDGATVCQGCAMLRRKAQKQLKKRFGMEKVAEENSGNRKLQLAVLMAILAIAACVSYYMFM